MMKLGYEANISVDNACSVKTDQSNAREQKRPRKSSKQLKRIVLGKKCEKKILNHLVMHPKLTDLHKPINQNTSHTLVNVQLQLFQVINRRPTVKLQERKIHQCFMGSPVKL